MPLIHCNADPGLAQRRGHMMEWTPGWGKDTNLPPSARTYTINRGASCHNSCVWHLRQMETNSSTRKESQPRWLQKGLGVVVFLTVSCYRWLTLGLFSAALSCFWELGGARVDNLLSVTHVGGQISQSQAEVSLRGALYRVISDRRLWRWGRGGSV